jgi:hypothetical protein
MLMLGVAVFANLSLIATAIGLVLGSISLLTGVIGYCPLWTLFGMNTCPAEMPEKR